MINRDNWKLTRAYLKYRLEIDQITPGSARQEKSRLYHLLEWADERPFRDAHQIRPSFPVYLLSARRDDREGQLSPVYVEKITETARRFFMWLSTHYEGHRAVGAVWLDTLQAPRMATQPGKHEAVTLEEIRAMANAPVRTGRERRIRAAAVLWFLSGIRIGAFVTLPLVAVDLDKRTIKQWPILGVRTKFKKHATTHLLDIPDLLAVVHEWDKEARSYLPDEGFWFAHLSSETGEITPFPGAAGVHRACRARKDLREWLERVGLSYHSPHKFRHGHAVYVLKRCKDIADLKAVSQNLMHTDLKVTDGVYGILSDKDVGSRIARLSNSSETTGGFGQEELVSQLEAILDQLRR